MSRVRRPQRFTTYGCRMQQEQQPRRFGFAFDPRYRRILGVIGIRPATAWAQLGRERLTVRFGPWRFNTPLANIRTTCVTGPYASALKAIGPHVSLADRGLSFGTTTQRGLCLLFHESVPGRETLGLIKHPGLTLTLDDIEGFRAALPPG